MAQTIPQGVVSDGMVKVAFTPTLVDPTAPSIATDLGTASAVELSCYLTPDGFGASAEEQTVTSPRLCSKQTFERRGTVQWSIDDLKYVYNTQDAAGDIQKAYEALVPGSTGFLVVGWGKDAEQAWAADDVVDVFPVELGERRKQAPESGNELVVLQKPYVTGDRNEDVALVA